MSDTATPAFVPTPDPVPEAPVQPVEDEATPETDEVSLPPVIGTDVTRVRADIEAGLRKLEAFADEAEHDVRQVFNAYTAATELRELLKHLR